MSTVEEGLIKLKKKCLNFEEEKGKSSNFFSLWQQVKTVKQEFYDLLNEEDKIIEKKPEFSKFFEEKKLNISILYIIFFSKNVIFYLALRFSEMDDLKEEKKERKEKSNYNFEKLMIKMEKEITLLSKVVEAKDLSGNFTKNMQTTNYLENQIIHYKETNENLENELKKLTLKLENTEKLLKTSKDLSKDNAFNDLETVLNLVNFINNNPGLNTIIFQEFKERVKLPISKEIFTQLEKINAKISNKKEVFSPISPAKTPTTDNKNKKRLHSAPNNKKKKIEFLSDSSKIITEISNTSKAIDKELEKYKDDYDKSLEIQKTNDEGHYILNKKKAILQLINGKLVVKLGNGFLKLKDFLQLQKLKKSQK